MGKKSGKKATRSVMAGFTCFVIILVFGLNSSILGSAKKSGIDDMKNTHLQTVTKPVLTPHSDAVEGAVEGSQVVVPVSQGGIPPPEFPKPTLAIFAPVNWPRDQYKVRSIDSTWGNVTDVIYYSMAGQSCEKMQKDSFHPQSTKDRFLCLNMTDPDEYARGIARPIWEKSWRSWIHMLETHMEDVDFFMKTDSDSFVAVENMKKYLSYFDPEKEWYFGHTLMHEWQQNCLFNTGIGYVISRGTARRLLPFLKAMTDDCPIKRACCIMSGPNEDAHMGSCLMDLGIVPTNTFDKEGRIRFYSFRPEDHVTIYREKTWYWALKPEDIKEGPECCNPYPVVMHNYKEKDTLPIFQELMQRFHYGQIDTPRISEYPDHSFFRYNEKELNFPISNNRMPCKYRGGEGCPAN